MIVCSKCRKEMICRTTGMRCVFGEDHVYAGDEFECKHCGARIVHTNHSPYNDPKVFEHNAPTHVLKMK